MARVALVHNLIRPAMLRDGSLDCIAEYDSEDTIFALSAALRAGGHEVIPVEADESIVERLKVVQPHVVFNVAEGIRGESRESHAPAICEMLGLPYTGSGPLTLTLCLDKSRASACTRQASQQGLFITLSGFFATLRLRSRQVAQSDSRPQVGLAKLRQDGSNSPRLWST